MKRISIYLLFFTTAIFFLLFNSHIPVTDPVEGNYALTGKEMLMSGDWLSPRIYGQFWYDKPIMIYWLILLCYKLFGINEFAARFPAAIFSILSVCFIYWFTYRIYKNMRIALLSALVLATSLEYWILAKMIITDAVLFFFTSVSMATFYLGLLDKGYKWYIIAYTTAALAVLTKGPVGIILPGITIFIYIAVGRRWGLLKELYLMHGAAVFLLVATPWYLYMYLQHGNDFINSFLGLHNYIRATVSEHPKDNVFYYYLVLFPLSLLPWTGVFLRMAVSVVKEFKLSHVNYLVVWPAVTIIFYTVMATKYPTYVFPATFPVAILIGRYLDRMLKEDERKQWLWLTVPMLLLLLSIGIGVRTMSSVHDWRAIYVMIAISFFAILWAQIKASGHVMLRLVAGLTVLVILLFNNQIYTFYADTRSAKDVVQILPKQGAEVASYGSYPTSAIFYSGYSMPNLVEHSDELIHEGAWAGKYIMPAETITFFNQQTANNPETYIIVDEHELDRFKSMDIAQQFIPVGAHAKAVLYKRKE
jgi:4-amino-4-deoxy-L-arabinose transferase-like glycosyltransferase